MSAKKSDSLKLQPDDKGSPASLLLYPNPASEKLQVKIPELKLPLAIKLKHIDGEEVYEQGSIKSRTFTLDVSSYKPGVYVLQVRSEGKVVSKKVIIQ